MIGKWSTHLLLISFLLVEPVSAAEVKKIAPAKIRLQQVFSSKTFHHPTFIAAVPGNRQELWLLEQAGRVWALPFSLQASPRLVLDLTSLVNSRGMEEGLLGLALDPEFSSLSGRARRAEFYLYYSSKFASVTTLSRFQYDLLKGVADLKSEKILLEIDQPYSNHNGGMIAFGPDKMLYVGVGDGGAAGDPHDHGQNLASLLGSILRLDVRQQRSYKIPPDNPFVGRLGARPEIWAYGLRNPWRFSFDRQSGTLWAGDVGQNAWEEINIIEPGGNYGWRLFEANHPFRNPRGLPPTEFKMPIIEYRHDPDGGYSVTGGYVYRGQKLPELFGRYLYGDFATGTVWSYPTATASATTASGAGRRVEKLAVLPNLSSFGEDLNGELYLINWQAGTIWLLGH